MPPGGPPIRLVLVDDHGLVREGLSRLLADEPGLALAAQCGSLAELRAWLDQGDAGAELMLLDFDLGDGTALDALKLLQTSLFTGRILLVTAGMAASEMARALDAGVAGIFLKHRPPDDLLRAMRHVLQGEQWLDAAQAQSLALAAHPTQGAHAAPPALSSRERAVLRGVFEGRANKEIAASLELSEASIKAVLQQLFAKTGVRTRAQLVRIALENRYEYKLEAADSSPAG